MAMTRRELIQFMDELVELSSEENKERAMSSKIYDLDDLIDIKEYVRRMEEEQRKKAEQKRGYGRQKIRRNTEAFHRERGGWSVWELT